MFHEAIPGDIVEYAPSERSVADWSPFVRRIFWVCATLFCLAAWGSIAWLGHAAWTSLF